MATLLQIRQRIGRELGSPDAFVIGTADTSSTQSSLVDKTFPVASSVRGTSFFKDWYILRPSAVLAADRVRVVSTYTPSGSSGILVPDNNWTNAPAAAETYELHKFFEPATALNDMINQGLKNCFQNVVFSFTPTAQAVRHSMAVTAPWLSDESWVRAVGVLSQSQTDRTKYSPGWHVRGTAVQESGTIYLDHFPTSFNATDTVYVQAMVPAYFNCAASGGTYISDTQSTSGQSGLTLDTDTVSVQPEWAMWAALIEGWRHMTPNLDVESEKRLILTLSNAVKNFNDLRDDNFELPVLRFRRLRRLGGPTRRMWPGGFY